MREILDAKAAFSLFFVEIIYYVIYRLIKNKRSICIIAFILALIAHYSRTEGVPNYFFWSSTIEAMLFFSLGTLFNDPIKIEKHLSKLGGAVSCVIYRLAFGHKIPDDHFIRIGILENTKILRSEKLKDMYFSIGYTSHLKSDE